MDGTEGAGPREDERGGGRAGRGSGRSRRAAVLSVPYFLVPGNARCVKFKWLLINGSLRAAEYSFYNELWACNLFKVEYG